MNLLARGNVWTSYVLRGSLQNACFGGNWRAGTQLQPIRNSWLSVAALLRSRTNSLGISGNESYIPWVLSPPHSYADKKKFLESFSITCSVLDVDSIQGEKNNAKIPCSHVYPK